MEAEDQEVVPQEEESRQEDPSGGDPLNGTHDNLHHRELHPNSQEEQVNPEDIQEHACDMVVQSFPQVYQACLNSLGSPHHQRREYAEASRNIRPSSCG